MKHRLVPTLALALFLAGHPTPCPAAPAPDAAAEMKRFVAQKESQTRDAAKASGTNLLPEFETLFTAAGKGHWVTVSNTFQQLRHRSPQYSSESHLEPDPRLTGTPWQAVLETWGATAAFGEGDAKYSLQFGRGIINSIPPGSIYFGGTDAGRFIVTALSTSHVDGDPFFTLTQNGLADAGYLEYVRSMYGKKIKLPTAEDSQKCFQDYLRDASDRKARNQLKPGEQVELVNGRVEVTSHVSIMNVNGLLAKLIFDRNSDREFYVEESFPLDWMYPYLEPHGLIMRINRQPLKEFSGEIVARDQHYWSDQLKPMIGDWLKPDTSVADVCASVKKIYLQHDFKDFTGDPRFIQNTYSRKVFSKLRSSHAGLYAWRQSNSSDPKEKERMAQAADFASRQAFALCPDSLEAIFRYVQVLMFQNRAADALLIAETAAQMPALQGADGSQLRALVENLKQKNPVK